MADESAQNHLVLSLDGGGAKGVYTLGVLKEVEAIAERPLCEVFSLIYGTSTGSIIAALLALGKPVDEALNLYMTHIPKVMTRWLARGKTKALNRLAVEIFGDQDFAAFRTDIGIVCTGWDDEAPVIFKSSVQQAHGLKSSFIPGFGCRISGAVVASCSAYPFFNKQVLHTANNRTMNLFDGGFCANNPTVFAIIDALQSLKFSRDRIKVLSVGCGSYPQPRRRFGRRCVDRLISMQLLQKTLGASVATTERLSKLLFSDLVVARINGSFTDPQLATDFLESDPTKLNRLFQRGRASFGEHEVAVRPYVENHVKPS